MDLRVLRYLVAIAQEHSVTAAAKRLHMTQPPLSSAIAGLEKEAGCPLLIRHAKGVELTEAGEYLVGRAAVLLRLAEDALEGTRRLGTGAAGDLTVASVRPACWELVPTILRRFTASNPDVTVSVVDALPSDVVSSVRTGEALVGMLFDVDAGMHDVGNESDLRRTVVHDEPLVALVPHEHPAAKAEVDIAQLENDGWAVPSRSEARGLWNLIEQAWRDVGIRPSRAESVVTLQTAVTLVECGQFVALLPESVRAIAGDRVAIRPTTDRLPTVSTLAIWRNDNRDSRLIARFLASAQRED